MVGSNTFMVKVILLFCLVCAVLCEHHKRDVHRIVIKQRIPRSQKKGHSHNHGHDHKRDHQHHHSGRSVGHKNKGKNLSSYEKDSYEDDRSYSRENSFEDTFQKHKGHKSHHHDFKKPHTSQGFPSFHVNQDYEEAKQIPNKGDSKSVFQNEWIPLSSEQLLYSSETYRDRHKKKRDSKRSYLTSLKPPPIELTTSYPFQFESSSIFPNIISYPGAFSNFNFDKKIIESNQYPLIGTIEQPNIQFSELKNNYNQLRNHQASYEVTELTPSDSHINTLISIPDDSHSEDSNEEVTTKSIRNTKEERKTTQRPMRTRGRITYRGQKKA